jgi:hypothetical protein
MQITLLPPLLPTEGVTSVPRPRTGLVAGARIVATVAAGDPGGHTLLTFGERQVPVRGGLPYAPGTRLRLEVIEAGAQPVLRVLGEVGDAGALAAPAEPEPGRPSVSPRFYGLAAAVMASVDAEAIGPASAAVARSIPALVSRGVLTAEQGRDLAAALAPLQLTSEALDTPEGRRTLADALADRVAHGGALLERTIADLRRRERTLTERALAGDLRIRLAFLARSLSDAPADLAFARDAVQRLQEVILSEQARTAAHFARDGVLDLRLDAAADTADGRAVRVRFEREAAQEDQEPATPWTRVRIDLDLAGLGRVQVLVMAGGAGLRTEFVVERPDSADAIEAGLHELGGSLEAAGFGTVLSRVVVDPVRACAPDLLPALPAPHAILDARA